MAIEYTIPQLLAQAGLRGYTPRLSGAINQLLNADNEIEYQAALQTATEETTGIRDYSDGEGQSVDNHFEGLPIYMPLILEGDDEIPDDLLLHSALVDFNRQKNIVTTIVQGRDVSVKEFINNGDFQIRVQGIIANRNAGYPRQEVNELKRFLHAKKSIKIVHEVLNMFGIHEIVITDYAFQNSSFINWQPYSFTAVNEVPIELRIDDE